MNTATRKILIAAHAQRVRATEYDTQENEDRFNEFCTLCEESMTAAQLGNWNECCVGATQDEMLTAALAILKVPA